MPALIHNDVFDIIYRREIRREEREREILEIDFNFYDPDFCIPFCLCDLETKM